MASRSSAFHQSLNRPKLLMGIEKSAFAGLALAGTFAFVAKTYWGIPIVAILFMVARWLSKRDDKFVEILFRYLNEDHVYDATPRPSDHQVRPKGWGKGIAR